MKARLIIDSEGPNPDFDPPRREHFPPGPEGDEAYHDADVLYDVPPVLIVPAGTILPSSRHVFVHCYPDSSGLVIDPKTRKPILRRRGVVRAEPVDEACAAALAKHVRHAAKVRGVSISVIEAEIAQAVADSKAAQKKIDAARSAPSAPGASAESSNQATGANATS